MITVCMLVKNESALIGELLEDLKNYFTNFLIVDNGSSDSTVSIAMSYGCRVIDSPDGNLDAARNIYFEHSKNPWILVIDADERLDHESILALQTAVTTATEDVYGFYIPRYEYTGSGQWAYTRVLRLIRNHPEIRHHPYRAMHTSPTNSIKALGGEIHTIFDARIHHLDILYKNRTNKKREIYRKKLLEDIEKNYFDATTYYYLGIEYGIIGKYEEAELYFQSALSIDPNEHKSRLFLAQQYLHLGNLSGAEQEATRILQYPNLTVSALILLSKIAFFRNEDSEVLRFSRRALDLSPTEAHLHINIASLLENRCPKTAVAHLSRAVELNPYLLNPIIYEKGESPNMFQFQTCLLPCVRTVFDHLEHCYAMLGNTNLKSKRSIDIKSRK